MEKNRFEETAALIVEVANKEGMNSAENAIELTLERFYADGVTDGRKQTWPWVLVNEMDGTETPYCVGDDPECDPVDIIRSFNTDYEVELGSLMETYLDLSDYDTFDEWEEAYRNEETDFDPIIIGLWNNLYIRNRYTGDEFHYEDGCDDILSFLLQYVADNWNDLK